MWLEGFTANMLNFVLGEVQRAGDSFVRCILSWLGCWLSGSEPDHKRDCAERSFFFCIHFLIFHFIYIIILQYICLCLYDHIKSRVFTAFKLLATHDQCCKQLLEALWTWSQVNTSMFTEKYAVTDRLIDVNRISFSKFVDRKIVISEVTCKGRSPTAFSVCWSQPGLMIWKQCSL